MTLFNQVCLDLISSTTIYTLYLTFRYSIEALAISWVLSLSFNFFQSRVLSSSFRFLWVVPGFGYALITLSLLKLLHVGSRYSMNSVLIAWCIGGVAYLSLSFQSALGDLDSREREAMRTLGASPLKTYYHFDFKRTLPAQAQALSQQFWLYLTSFSLVMILSGGFPNETLEVGIYTAVRLADVDWAHAIALGIWQMFALIPLRFGMARFPVRVQASEWVRGKRRRWEILSVVSLSLVAVTVILCLVVNSELETGGLIPSLLNSLTLSVVVAFLSVAWVMLLYSLRVVWIAEIGAWVSPMLLTLLWWKWFGFTLVPFVNAVLIQILLFSPWVTRILVPTLRRARVRELEAAKTLGATPFHAWRAVELPRILPRLRLAFVMVMSVSMAEVTAVLLFSDSDFEPLSVWIQNSLLRFRIQEALVGTLILIVLSYGCMMIGREES